MSLWCVFVIIVTLNLCLAGISSTCYLKKLQAIRKQFSANGPHQRNKRAKPPKSTEDFDKVTTFKIVEIDTVVRKKVVILS